MKYLLLILLGLLTARCHRRPCFHYNPEIYIYVKNFKGENLLDPNVLGSYKKDSIKVFYLKFPKAKYPANFSIDSSGDKYSLSINADKYLAKDEQGSYLN